MSFSPCIEGLDESTKECARYEDHGYQACSGWSDNCCDWWPCSWGCDLITWICYGWYWVTNLVCVSWTFSNTLVCMGSVIAGVITTPLNFIAQLGLAIPGIGRVLDEVLNVVTEIVARLAALPDVLLTFVGITPLKRLRLGVIILRDEKGAPTATEADVQVAIQEASNILRDAANVQILVLGIEVVDDPSPSSALDVGCNVDAWGQDLWTTGTYFEQTATWHFPTQSGARLTGWGNPVIAFAVRSVEGASTLGCALGPLTDYLTIEGSDPKCLAHELSHKVGLWHCCEPSNLAFHTCGGTELRGWQRAIVRDSKYVTYM
jgi:hypothetical protein